MSEAGMVLIALFVLVACGSLWGVWYVMTIEVREAWEELRTVCKANNVPLRVARREVRAMRKAGAPKAGAIHITSQKVQRGLVDGGGPARAWGP